MTTNAMEVVKIASLEKESMVVNAEETVGERQSGGAGRAFSFFRDETYLVL